MKRLDNMSGYGYACKQSTNETIRLSTIDCGIILMVRREYDGFMTDLIFFENKFYIFVQIYKMLFIAGEL